MVLCSIRAAAETGPPPVDTLPISFDARQPFAQPSVHVEAFGRARAMILDTGCRWHVIGFEAAGINPPSASYEQAFGTDYAGRIISGIPAPTIARLPGWPPLEELMVSTWADPHLRGRFIRPGEPHADGVISPIRLAGPERVVVIDFTTGTLSAGSWKDAEARLGTAPVALTPSPATIGADGMLVVPMVAGDHTLRMALDTGAPTSWLFVPRGKELPDGLARVSERTMQVRVGEMTSSVHFWMMERRDSPSTWSDNGVLGMDVLRTCILALDGARFVARCLADGSPAAVAMVPRRDPPAAMPSDLLAMRTSRRTRKQTVQVGSNELEMRQRADGGYEWTGDHLKARVRRDGRVSFSKVETSCRVIRAEVNRHSIFNQSDDPLDCPIVHTKMDAEDERRWLEEQVGDLLVALARAQEREVIEEALEELPRRLSAILADKRMPLAERRRIVFLLWDEMAEPGDTERGWAGARARRLIELFVQDRLPPGAPGAFTAAEVAAFNRTRRNGIRFDPYAPPASSPDPDTGDN